MAVSVCFTTTMEHKCLKQRQAQIIIIVSEKNKMYVCVNGSLAGNPLGADSSACNAFRAKICPWKHSRLRILSAPSLFASSPSKAPLRSKAIRRNGGGCTTATLPNAFGASTAGRTGRTAAHPLALFRDEKVRINPLIQLLFFIKTERILSHS